MQGEITDTGFDLDFYGTFLGLTDVRFEANLNTALSDNYDDADGNGVYDPAEPLIAAGDRAPVGIYNAAETWDDLNHNGVVDAGEFIDLDGNGVYDPLGDLFVDLNLNGVWDAGDRFLTAQNAKDPWQPTAHDLNGNGVYDAAVMRVGTEFVVGAAPEACTISPTAFQGTQEAEEVKRQLLSMLAHLGLTDDPAALAADVENAALYAFDWIDLNNLSSAAGACVRAFSPGFDPRSSDPLRRSGGIEAYATLGIGNLLEGDFSFQIQPSSVSPIVPNVNGRAAVKQILLPGLEGLNSTVDTSILGSELELLFSVQDGAFEASLEGTLTLLGQQFTLAGDTALQVYDDGLVGAIQLVQDFPEAEISASLASLSGEFTLVFDTRPQSLSAAVIGQGDISWPGFSLEQATFEIQVDAEGLHVREVSGHSTLFGQQLDFSGGFSLLPVAPYLDNFTLSALASVVVEIGPGQLQGTATATVDSQGIRGSFNGNGTIFGVTHELVSGQFDSAGCLTITSPVNAHFQLPGSDAFCGEANAAVALDIGPDIAVLEGDPGDPTTSVTLEVIATRFGATEDDPKITIDWEIPGLGSVADDLILPSDRTLNFDFAGGASSVSQFITIQVVRDTFFEERELFPIAFDTSTLHVTPDATEVVYQDPRMVLEVLNDDAPEVLDSLNPPNDALVFFSFDNFSAGGAPLFTAQSTTDAGPLQLDEFEPSEATAVGTTVVRGTSGLPAVYSEPDGNIVLGVSRALKATSGDSPIDNGYLHNDAATIQFTVDPEQTYWRPDEIEFLVKGDRPGDVTWALTWSLDDFATPIATSEDEFAETFTADEFPGWVKHRTNITDRSLFCTNGAITFQLTILDSTADHWTIDNLALSGETSANCLGQDPDELAAELEQFLDQMDHRLPGSFELSGPGTVLISLVQDPGDVDPDPYDQLQIEIFGASPTETTLRFVDNGDNPSPEQLVYINVVSQSGLKNVDFSDAGLFRGLIDVNGSVTDPMQLGGLHDGSSVLINNGAGSPVDIVSTGPFGMDVQIDVSGDISLLDVQGGWVGGALLANSLSQAQIQGDFAADVALQQGLGCFEVFGGDLASGNFSTGLAAGEGNGDASCIQATAVGGVGGSMSGNYSIDGDIGEFVANGGSFDGTLTAEVAGLIQASLDTTTSTGGDIAGNIQIDSYEDINSVGGTISATVETYDAVATSGLISALMLNGLGGRIMSPNSFHFAGDVAGVIGHDIELRIVSQADVHSIRAVSDPAGNPPKLVGDFTAHRFGTIVVDRNGTAGFDLTTTGEAWQFDGQTAWDLIDAPQGDWLERIDLQPGTEPGTLVVDGRRLDRASPDGMLLDNNQRLEIIRRGFDTTFHVIPASWHNVANPVDVNADGFVSPRDALQVIFHLNRDGGGPLPTPSVLTELPAPFFDCNDDGFLSPVDALLVIRFLNQGDGEGEQGPLLSSTSSDSTRPAESTSRVMPLPAHTDERILTGNGQPSHRIESDAAQQRMPVWDTAVQTTPSEQSHNFARLLFDNTTRQAQDVALLELLDEDMDWEFWLADVLRLPSLTLAERVG